MLNLHFTGLNEPVRWRFARLALRFLPLALLVLGAGVAWAVDVPFPTEHTIEGAFDGFAVHAADVDGDGAVSVYAADVDGDGDLDVLGAALDADDITWWENLTGAGTIWTKRTIEGAFDGAISVYAADVDGDGDLDVLGAAGTDDDITWWENPGGAATTDGTTWTTHTIEGAFDGARSVHAADVNGDGDLDVLGAASKADDITWWENPGGAATTDGTTWTTHTIEGAFDGAISVRAADVDGDGDLDVLGAAFAADDITWWENLTGAGTSWTEHTIEGAFSGVYSVDAADVDGDGDLDVLGAALDADDISWWENLNGAGTSWTEHTIDAAFDGAVSVYAADVDGDGDLDVLGAAAIDSDITWWENETIHRNAVFPVERTIAFGIFAPTSVQAADLDSDGDMDVLAAAFTFDDVAWWENNGMSPPGFGPRKLIDGVFDGANSVRAADLDGDGDLDVLGAASFDDDIAWWENDGMSPIGWSARKVIDGTFNEARSVQAADLDGDGDLDVLGAASLADEIAWWENDGMSPVGWSARKVIDGALNGADVAYAADLDGDGDLDVLGGGFFDEIAWWENDGMSPPGFGSRKVIDAAFDGVRSVYAADLDGDGDLDVLGADGSANEIAWWKNDGSSSPSFGSRNTIDNTFNFAFSVHAEDLDGDGDLDVLGSANNADEIAWWENDGMSPPGFGSRKVIDGTFDGATSALAADLDADGDLDVLGTASTDNQVTWWENRGGQFALPTTAFAPAQVTSPGELFVLQVDAVHNGRTGDNDVELATFELLFTDGTTPLSDAQANSVIENVRVYHEAIGPDPLIASVSTLSLTNGVQQISIADGNPDAQVVLGTDEVYSISLDFIAGGLLDTVRVTHLIQSSSTAEDRVHDIPLKLEFAPNVSTATMILQQGVCPSQLIRANQTLTGTQTLEATAGATLGENLTINGDNIVVNAPTVSILSGTAISGTFSVGSSPACP